MRSQIDVGDVLELGGTPVDDAIKDLVALSEMALTNVETQKELDALVDLINATKISAKNRLEEYASQL